MRDIHILNFFSSSFYFAQIARLGSFNFTNKIDLHSETKIRRCVISQNRVKKKKKTAQLIKWAPLSVYIEVYLFSFFGHIRNIGDGTIEIMNIYAQQLGPHYSNRQSSHTEDQKKKHTGCSLYASFSRVENFNNYQCNNYLIDNRPILKAYKHTHFFPAARKHGTNDSMWNKTQSAEAAAAVETPKNIRNNGDNTHTGWSAVLRQVYDTYSVIHECKSKCATAYVSFGCYRCCCFLFRFIPLDHSYVPCTIAAYLCSVLFFHVFHALSLLPWSVCSVVVAADACLPLPQSGRLLYSSAHLSFESMKMTSANRWTTLGTTEKNKHAQLLTGGGAAAVASSFFLYIYMFILLLTINVSE